MAKISSGSSVTPAEESTPIGNTPNESHPWKPAVENTETENEGRKPATDPQISFSIFGHVPGFTHFISQRNPSNPDKIFASSLFASGHGYPLFYPDTMLELDDDFRNTRGISIGDVGFLSSKNQFIFMFNIFLPADHPYNKDAPESFLPLSPLQDSEICTTPGYFPRGYVIASKGVKVTRHSEDPLHLTFNSSERRGAVMVLPEGAVRHDISMTSTRVFHYVKDNAVSWTRHFAHSRYPVANGSPYVVTGVDKTSACANLAFPIRPPWVEMSARYEDGLLHSMESMSFAREATADQTLSPIPNNLCIFMRGIRIGLGRTAWIENVDGRTEANTFYTEIFVDTPRLRLPLLKTTFFGKDEQVLSLNDKSFFKVHAFHPSDIAAQIMLCLDQNDATAALVDDSIWSIFSQAVPDGKAEVQRDPLTFTCSRGCSLDDFCSMFDEVFVLFKVVKSQGVLALARTSVERVSKDPWHKKLWFWLSGRQRVRGGTVFKELFRQGQFHFKTNDDLRSTSRL